LAAAGRLCATRADGSHPLRLTPRWRISSPTWSPRGRYVAFERWRSGSLVKATTPAIRISVADVQGRGHIRSTFGAARTNVAPIWSPDGRHIAYLATEANIITLHVARPDGSEDRELAAGPPWSGYGPWNPAWTPDGQTLAFDDGNGRDAPQGIFTVGVDGSKRRMLVANAREPAYSPDGSKLAYVAVSGSQRVGLFVADADGSHSRRLTSSADAAAPTWSPRGTLIAFKRADSLRVVRADGSGERAIASHVPSAPLWSPRGQLIAFVRGITVGPDRPFESSIVVARADGGHQRVVVRRFSKSFVEQPAWRAAVPLPAARRLPCSLR
jgi:Tol biopolymer transport system component